MNKYLTPACLALGSNLGDRDAALTAALEKLSGLNGTQILREATRIVTKPMGGPPGQGDYLNSACLLETTLEPLELLRETQRIERELGRIRDGESMRWGPRTIDIDILLYGNTRMDQTDLTIPHPRLEERRFVLEPLAEIAPDFLVPGTGIRVAELLKRLDII